MPPEKGPWALSLKSRLALFIQREIGRVFAPLVITAIVVLMRYVYRYKIRDVEAIRKRFQEIIHESDRPLLICANHLTMVDSFIASWALASGGWYIMHFSKLPWHVPERRNFAATWYIHLLIYLLKCVPIIRGGNRHEVSEVLSRLEYLLEIGETVFLFPEGTRSRTGRLQTDSIAHGVGRIIDKVPTSRTLCLYMRGDHQETWGEKPITGETFYVDLSIIEPKSQLRGVRRSQDLAQQVVAHLMEMEQKYFASRGK